jgi:transposase
MIGAQRLAMTFLERSMLDGQTVQGVDANILRATRLMRLFNEQVETMAKLKGKGGQQRVVVEHVTVAAGGQAVVGMIAPGGALERFYLVRSTAAMVLQSPEVPMAPYSMDLRKRVARAWDAGGDAEAVAAKYDVSRAWVHRLIQRRRETGSLAPRTQTKFRRRVLTAREEERLVLLITARPDATLTELRDALPTTAALATLWRTIERLGFTLKKNGTRRRATPA